MIRISVMMSVSSKWLSRERNANMRIHFSFISLKALEIGMNWVKIPPKICPDSTDNEVGNVLSNLKLNDVL